MQIDWFAVLLFFFFIVLPLLQHIASKRKQAEGEEGEAAPGEETLPREGHRPQPMPDQWDAWDEPEGERRRELPSAWEELGLDDLFRAEPRPEPRAEPRPRPQADSQPRTRPRPRVEPAPETRPTPSPVPAPRTEPRRSSESWDDYRVERTPPPTPTPVTIRPDAAEPAVRTVPIERREEGRGDPAPKRAPRKYALSEQSKRPTTVAARVTARELQSTQAARKAIILAEVLGPPRSLRDLANS
jgi:hypothetical protein